MKKFCKDVLACGCVMVLMGTMLQTSVLQSSAVLFDVQGYKGSSPSKPMGYDERIARIVDFVEDEVNAGNGEKNTAEVKMINNTALAAPDDEFIVSTPYDKEVFTENGMEFHYIAGDTWQGLMVIVKNPSRVFVGMPRDEYNGLAGASSYWIGKRYKAQFAVNGAFFVDTNLCGNGGTPIGFVFSEGKQKAGSVTDVNTIMGLTEDNHFICATMSGEQALDEGIRDAVSCGPILVQNGQIADLRSKSTTLMDARTALGARLDGSILILQVDGRMSHSIGATTRDLAECMISFGAISAGNLDGGGSVSNYYTGATPIHDLSSSYGSRAVPNAICVRPE